ncbi:hypothetical protein KSP39_PZI013859 [Platanthera zijinensis]|uniref:Uncharacterized protein n=1 Tax=Platanthera zijinensis TaxID=2320716 RepID=A0AAP0BBS7_9ASPA
MTEAARQRRRCKGSKTTPLFQNTKYATSCSTPAKPWSPTASPLKWIHQGSQIEAKLLLQTGLMNNLFLKAEQPRMIFLQHRCLCELKTCWTRTETVARAGALNFLLWVN